MVIMFYKFKKKVVFASFFLCFPVLADEYFDPSLLESVNGIAPTTDLKSFEHNKNPPGDYRVKITINSDIYDQRLVKFIVYPSGLLGPCFTRDEYSAMGVDLHSKLSEKLNSDKNDLCYPIPEAIKGATVQFDLTKLELKISIPQLALLPQESINPSEGLWDDGITAFVSNYRLEGSSTRRENDESNSSLSNENFLNWNNGFNIGPWRARNLSTWSNNAGWQSTSTYIERAIKPLKSELSAGEFSTQQDIFESIPLKGIQLASDTSMLADKINGFAPVVRGIAKSYAQVTVRDAGNIIYQTNVSPGPFAIKDIVPVSNGGVLDVIVKESNGVETNYSIPYATVPMLQRQGQLKFSLAIGELNQDSFKNNLKIMQLSMIYGLPFDLTVITGTEIGDSYKSASIGIGLDAGILGGGSITTINEQSNTELKDKSESGMATRLSYSKVILSSDTTIQIDNWLYSDKYMSFQDSHDPDRIEDITRNQQSLNINQPVDDEGESIYLNFNRTKYNKSSDKMYQAGFDGSLSGIQYSISVSQTKSKGSTDWDKQIAMNISIPFSTFTPKNTNGSASFIMTQNNGSDNSELISISDSLNESQSLQYTASTSYANDEENGAFSLDNKESYGESTVGYNYSANQKQMTYGVSGGVILHKNGVTLSQYMENSSALVSVKGVKDISIDNATGIKTDNKGYAVVPDIMPYRENDIRIKLPKNEDNSINIDNFVNTITPTKDAIILSEFKAQVGRKVVVTLLNGPAPLPFGTRVILNGNEEEYYVADHGIVYITGMPEKGVLTANLHQGATCKANFSLNMVKEKNNKKLERITLKCM